MDFSEQKWAKQSGKWWGLSYGVINRSYQEYVSLQEQTYVQADAQLCLTRTVARETSFRVTQMQPGRVFLPVQGKKPTEKMRVLLERDKTI